MRTIVWVSVVLMGLASAGAAEQKEKKKDKQEPAAAQDPATVGTEKPKGKADRKDSEKVDKAKQKSESDARTAKKAAEEAKEAGGDESELDTLAQALGLSDSQKKEIAKEFERYRARLAQIKALPDKSHNEKLLKGPQRRALRNDLAKWVSAHVSPGQAQKFDAYEKKRTRDILDEHIANRVTKLVEALHLNENQQSKAREIYDVQLRGVQNAADELYAASQKTGTSIIELEKALDARREAMKKAIEGILKPEQAENYRKLED